MSHNAPPKTIRSPRFGLVAGNRGWYKHIPGVGTKYVCSLNAAATGEEADAEYVRRFPELTEIRSVSESTLTVNDVFNLWLADREAAGISAHTLKYYRMVARKFQAITTDTLPIARVGPSHVDRYRAAMGDVAVTTKRNLLVYLQSAMNFAARRGFIRTAWGDAFNLPTQKDHRVHKAEQVAKRGLLMFTPDEIRRLLKQAGKGSSPYPLKLWVLLGINGALGQSDLDVMTRHHVHEDRLIFPRQKTGVHRTIPLWPETRKELDAWMKTIPKGQDHIFLTVTGKRLHGDAATSTVAKQFHALCVATPVPLKGHYSLRRTFRTMADEQGDRHAIDIIMGHEPKDIGRSYVQSVDHARLVSITEHVRSVVFKRTSSR